MASSVLSASGIDSLVQSYTQDQTTKRVTPIQTRVTSYQNMDDAWTSLTTMLTSLKSSAYDLQSSTSSTYFGAKTATSSNSSCVTATATNTASVSSYDMRVSQLAKNDIAVSDTMATSTAVTNMAGTHTIQFTSGDYTSSVDVALTDSETNGTVMQKISDAINNSKAVVNSGSVNASSTFTGKGQFTLNLNGTKTNISYDYSSGKSYSDVVDDLAQKINTAESGKITAEKIVDGQNVSLRFTVANSSQYLTIDPTTDTGGLLGSSGLNLSATKAIAAGGIVSTALFTPSSGNSKLSFTAVNSGYDNRLQMTDTIGLNSSVVSAHKSTTDDNSAGYIYSVNSSTDNQLNAKLLFNGINIQSNTNSITTLANGVTFNLSSVTSSSDSDVNLSVQSDVATVTSKLNDYISKFNAVYTYVKSKSTTDSSGRGIFVGDESAQALLQSMTNLSIGKVSGIPDNHINYLSEMGITFDPSSGLSVTDNTKLSNAISTTPDQVAALFNSSSGIATQLYAQTSRYLGSSGVIANLQNSLNTTIKYNQDKITSLTASITKSAQTLKDQYDRLQSQYISLVNASNAFSSTMGSSSSG
jgi:flagellar hook-associated protein 2